MNDEGLVHKVQVGVTTEEWDWLCSVSAGLGVSISRLARGYLREGMARDWAAAERTKRQKARCRRAR